ncbi:MAG: ABC transporter ATP-binding protein [Anaerolineae bacterium]|nr:ABC transporter ATP-binding protein [Anaerolineae bacterium]
MARAGSNGHAIVAQGVGKRFGDFQAVQDLSFALDRGEVLALLGPNGAGKTTTVRLIASLLRPSEGSIRVFGHDTVREATAVRLRVGLLTEAPGLYARMRAEEYLAFFGRLYGMTAAQLAEAVPLWLKRLGLWEARSLRLGEYSKGMRQKLALARALLHRAPLLLLDEPTSALDPAWAHRVHEIIRELRAQGHAIVVCTHNLAEAQALADRVLVLKGGRAVLEAGVRDLGATSPQRRLMEVRLARPVPVLGELVGQWVEVERAGADWVRFWTEDPVRTNPPLLQRLTAEGIPVVTLSEVQRSLEEVYLAVMGQDEEEAGP